MSDAAPVHSDPHAHAHPKHLAHHFDSPEQQYVSAKLGMWVFLGTEILMFGGLFCAYGVYRYSHPEVFEFAHVALDRVLGGINTAVLIASSFTMALGVRYSQLGQTKALCTCLILTILGGFGFMAIKSIEYKTKWEHHLFPGTMNVFNYSQEGKERPESLAHGGHADHPTTAPATMHAEAARLGPTTQKITLYSDPLAGTPDESRIKPPFVSPVGLGRAQVNEPAHGHVTFSELSTFDQARVNTFFSIYFCMTGLHGLHVMIGMGLITWVLIRARKGEFGPEYFTPVDIVGLYWHLVDLIWIFLFPLLYLIH